MTQSTDRLQSALRGINQALNPRQVFAMTWEYTVIDATPGPPTKIDCQVVDPETSAHLPQQLTQLVLWPGPSGAVAVPAPGSLVRIGFVNGDPTKPFVQGLDPNSKPLTVVVDASVEASLGPSAPVVQLAGGGPPIARVGDSVLVTISIAQGALFVAPPGGGPCVVAAPIPVTGTITSGSLKATSG